MADLNQPARGTTIQATERVPLRAGPSASDTIITSVPLGHTATVLSPTPSNGFYHVNYRGSVGSRSWCYSTGWPTSARYAPDKAAALRSIREIMAIHYALAPEPGLGLGLR